MGRQIAAPFDHVSLNPSFQSASWLARRIRECEITMDPPYQRGNAWTEDQRMALVQTWLRGLPAGVVILADRCTDAWTAANRGQDPYETGEGLWACVDGKQRLTTAVMWFGSEFAIPASWLPADHVDVTEDTDDGPYVRQNGLTPKGCWPTLKMPTGPALKVPITENKIAPLGWSQWGDCRRGVAVVGEVPRLNQSNFMPKYGSGSPV
ncbi:DUF262 domain-containing protein [Streptomyces sp. OK228]|uniref:DUF262 domain-containing protein n=1 Tax=Streptomyces sp. OK228 TaxID=1882786 RepID=UPI000BCC7B29|nr:DUF262 domain-containing protein [Streptomyces sp. OK228]SOE31843.1 Protein of unknown function DUF262 [Streptomyces sp. OK228]